MGSHSAFQGAPRGAHSPELGYAAGQMRPQYSGGSGGGGSATGGFQGHQSVTPPLHSTFSGAAAGLQQRLPSTGSTRQSSLPSQPSNIVHNPSELHVASAGSVPRHGSSGGRSGGSGSMQHHHGQKSFGARQKGVSPHPRAGTPGSALFTDMSTMSSRTVATDLMNRLEGSRVALEFALDKLAAQRPPGVLVGRCCNPRTRLLDALILQLDIRQWHTCMQICGGFSFSIGLAYLSSLAVHVGELICYDAACTMYLCASESYGIRN